MKLSSCKVLLIEDERIVREIVVRMLNFIGITHVAEAASAEAAWSYLISEENKGLHLIITDLTLPGISGVAFVRRLRSLPTAAAAALPIIVLTASSDLETYRKAAQAKISGYLIKPVTPALLRVAIEKDIQPENQASV